MCTLELKRILFEFFEGANAHFSCKEHDLRLFEEANV